MKYNSIRSWAKDDRPREKLIDKGSAALSNSELIAILIGSGNKDESAVELSKRLLSAQNDDLTILAKKTIKELQKFKGIGQAKAVSIVAALELARRLQVFQGHKKIVLNNSLATSDFLKPILMNLVREEFWILLLNNRLELLYHERMFTGTVIGTAVDIKMILRKALEYLAVNIIIAHNHPSGQVRPSQADIQITKKINQAAKFMEIRLADHVIIGNQQYFSFADEGLIS